MAVWELVCGVALTGVRTGDRERCNFSRLQLGKNLSSVYHDFDTISGSKRENQCVSGFFLFCVIKKKGQWPDVSSLSESFLKAK